MKHLIRPGSWFLGSPVVLDAILKHHAGGFACFAQNLQMPGEQLRMFMFISSQ